MAKGEPTKRSSGASKGAKPSEPERRCIVTRENHPASALVRFVLDPEGVVTPDLDSRLPGRGLYVLPQRPVLDTAIKRNAFAKAAKARAIVPEGLPDQLLGLLDRRFGRQLGLARRAGEAIAGFEKVRDLLKAEPVALLLGAQDAGTDGREKLTRLAHARGQIAVYTAPVGALELGGLLGREQAVHVAVRPGGLATSLLRTLQMRAGLSAGGRDTMALLDVGSIDEQDRGPT